MLQDDYLATAFSKFFEQRQEPLWTRFHGLYRAMVVETNDPLVMHRIRVRIPEMHDQNLKPEECPWALPSANTTVFHAGKWEHPCIGDFVWIAFEKNHPYAPLWLSIAPPTRRKNYAYPAVFQPTPLPVDDEGKPDKEKPMDYNQEYLPKDGRPMSRGWQDRYGNLDFASSVGFFPDKHGKKPAPPGYDAIQKQDFEPEDKPEPNKPDVKLMARITKYGMIHAMGDQGYHWLKKDPDDGFGEFTGDPKKDEAFEIKRWLYLQRLVNEDKTDGNDQRNMLSLTRYGHKFEMRDTGWAQPKPIESKSRKEEYLDEERFLSDEKEKDFRWMKWRSKGGWLLQSYDKGFDPKEDVFIKRKLVEEVADKTEKEHDHWKDKDARWFRLVGRHGFKWVIDERGTDPKDAFKEETPRGNGMLIKGRRTGGAGDKAKDAKDDPRGFFWEFNEQDTANHTMWGTPLGMVMEMSDREEYITLCTRLKKFSTKWKNIEENEFIRETTRLKEAEKKTHHLTLDLENEFIRLKSRAGKGADPDNIVNPTDLSDPDLNQGVEIRDGKKGDGVWIEFVDAQHRGLWFSKNQKLGIWRAKQGKQMMIWVDEEKKEIVVYNKEQGGKVRIVCDGDMEFISANGNISFQAKQGINFKAQQKVNINVGASRFSLDKSTLRTTANYEGPKVTATTVNKSQPGGDQVQDIQEPQKPNKIEPSDRGTVYNEAIEVPQEDIEHPIKPPAD